MYKLPEYIRGKWTKQNAGSYVNEYTGTVIERAESGGWNVINPETGGVLDNLPTKREAQRIYK